MGGHDYTRDMSHKTQYVLQGLLSTKIGKAYQSEAQFEQMNGLKKDSLTRLRNFNFCQGFDVSGEFEN